MAYPKPLYAPKIAQILIIRMFLLGIFSMMSSSLVLAEDYIPDHFTFSSQAQIDPNQDFQLELNATGCNSIEDIVGAGGGEEVFADGFENN